MIELNNISKIFKAELLSQPFVALNDVSFKVPQGSMVGFLGANGAGKTTSLKIIMDFIRPTSGHVRYDEKLGKDKKEAFKNIGFLPERPYFYQNLTGRNFIFFMGKLSGLDEVFIKKQLDYWGPRFKIDYALDREIKTYSKGMLQRIGFLTTILHQPKMIILDEPLSGLDPIGRKELKDVMIELHKEGKTVFFSSHIVPDIEEICDRVIFLKSGKLIYDGSVSSLIQTDKQNVFSAVIRTTDITSLGEISKSVSLPDGVSKIYFSAQFKNKILRECFDRNIDILNLEMMKPSLEEIFYKSKNHE